MANHPGIIDDADIPPTWTPLRRSSVKATPVEGTSTLTLVIELDGQSDFEWDGLFKQLAQEYLGDRINIVRAGGPRHRSCIALSIDEQYLEQTVADADSAIASTNVSYEQHVMTKRIADFEARQAEKGTLEERQAALNERIMKLNAQD